MDIRLTIQCLGLLLMAGACATSNPPEDASEEPQAEAVAKDNELETLVSQAVADLAQRLSIPEDDVERVRAERVTWRDSSLGCPEPGMMYMQALQPGVLIELRAGGTAYRYHSTSEGPPVYCAKPSKKDPLPAAEEMS